MAAPKWLCITHVRAYVKDNFVDKGMCADFAIHDKGTGNPHVHIMLTLRPLKENGQWGAKCRKAYDLDENGQRIPDGKGGWKNHREDTTDWNDKGNVEIWRAAWAAYTNRALESAGRPERIDHRSYKRQGIDKIPSVHLGPAASQMEKRGIRTDKGEVNRQIVADNKLLKEIKARITRLYRWSKAEAEKPQTQQSSLTALWEAQQQLNAPRTRTGKIRALQESAALFSFLQVNGIQSMQQLHEKIADMNSCYYDLRGKIVKAERRIAILTERGEMWEQYNQYKSIHKQLALVRAYVKDNFVDKGMCADFAIHDKETGNPHVHIMLTVRPLKENGAWGAKCRKAYDLDENGQRIPDERGGWKNHREDTTDWNDKGNVEIWRAAWAAYINRALESAGRPERIDHRSYKRQGIDKIPSVHLGPAASQMEKRGIRTDKSEVNRQIAADNKLLKEIKARITRLYNWSKAEAEKPEGQQPSMIDLWEAQQQLKRPDTRTGKIRALQESAALFSFLQANGIQSMQQLHEKIADMNTRYYDLRGKIVKAERRIATLTERGEMWEQYNQYKSIHKQLAKVKPEKREQFEQRHSRELILYDAAARYLKELKDSGEGITPKAWQREIDQLAAGKQTDTLAMKSMREELKAVERLRKTAEQLSRQERDKPHDRGPER